MIKKLSKKTVSVFLSLLLVVVAVMPAASAVTYPQNVTKEKSLAAIEKTDSFIYNILKATQNTTLKAIVCKELYSDKTLSALLTGVYTMLEENQADLLSVNIDVSVKAVAKGLSAYKNVANELSQYNSWNEVKSLKASWGVNDKDSFCRAVSASLTPFNEIIYTLLCSGNFQLNSIVGVKGGNGYESAIVPTLRSLGCKSITDSARFYSDAQNEKGMMVYHIVYDLMTLAEEVLSSPADRLTDILPGIAYFFNNGGFDRAVEKLIEPLTLQLGSITTFIKIKGLLNFIADPSSMTQNFDINSLVSSGEFKVAEIDLAELASCGTVFGDTVTPDKADCFVVVLRFIIDTLKLNKDKMGDLTKELSAEKADFDVAKIANNLLSKETDELVELYISLLTQESAKINDVQWTFKEFTPAEISYTQNLGQEKFQRVLDGIDALIDEFVAEGGEEKTLKALLSKQIFSSATVTSLVSGVYSAFDSDEMKALATLMGLDITPSNLASQLSNAKYYSARNVLYSSSSWKSVGTKNINWGFKEGDSKAFAKVLSDCLEPFEPMVNMLLAGGKANLAGIDFYGSDGYNTAVIPLFEALSFESKTIPTYAEYKKQAEKGNSIQPLVEAVCAFIDRFAEKPVYTLTEAMPNFIYFIENDGLALCVKNLLYPITSLTSELGIENVIDFSALQNIDINKLTKELMGELDLGITLADADIKMLGTIGQLKTVESKRTSGGAPVTVSYIEADKTAVLVTGLRYVVEVIKTPGNESIMNSFMGGGAEGGNDMFATYSSGIGEEMAAMTTDETVEWLYKLFFRERAVVEEKPQDDYLPTIIYEKQEESTTGRTFVAVMIAICAVEIYLMKKTGRIERYFEDRKIKKKLKDEYEKKGEQEA